MHDIPNMGEGFTNQTVYKTIPIYISYCSIMPKRKAELAVDRLGSWYSKPKYAKKTPVDQVTAIMAPRNSVTGSAARDQIMKKVTDKMGKGIGVTKKIHVTKDLAQMMHGGDIGQIPKDKRHSKKHPGFHKVAEKIARKEHLPIERANAILAASTRRHLEGGSSKVERLMPQESKVNNQRGTGVHRSVPDIVLNPELSKMVNMLQGESPLDKENTTSPLKNQKVHQYNLVKNYKSRNRKVPGLNPRRKITKGGRTYTSLKNLLVTPNSAP